MGKRWFEPDTEHRFKLVLWLLVAALVCYFLFRLGMALAQLLGAIQRSYQV